MTQADIDNMRRAAAIEGELRILAVIDPNSYSVARAPHLLGPNIQLQCVERIRELNNGGLPFVRSIT